MNHVRKTNQPGFTVVELMMSLAVLAVGVSGIIAMQKVTAMSNMHSKSVALATQIANSWQDQLLVDGTVWRTATGLAPTTWLNIANSSNTWFLPTYDATRRFGPAFDALGNPINPSTNIDQAQFCVHLQLVPIVALASTDNATLRATVRVFWPRVQSTNTDTVNFCAASHDVAEIGAATDKFHFIYQTFAIRVHP